MRARLCPLLTEAAIEGDLPLLANLLARGADARMPDPHSSSKRTPLMHAAIHGHADCVRLLLPHSDLHTVDPDGLTPLMFAARHGHADCIRPLLDGSDFSAQCSSCMTALMHAADAGHADCLLALLPFSNPNAFGRIGLTAAMHSAARGHLDCLALLIPATDLAHRDRRGATALMHACRNASDASCANAILQATDPHALNPDGHSEQALYAAAQNGSTPCADLLLARHAFSPRIIAMAAARARIAHRIDLADHLRSYALSLRELDDLASSCPHAMPHSPAPSLRI